MLKYKTPQIVTLTRDSVLVLFLPVDKMKKVP